MQPFAFERAASPAAAVRTAAAARAPSALASGTQYLAQYLAGGTTLLDLMKLDVMRPQTVVDINGLADGAPGLLQPPRATYFRDVSYAACNKRIPGSGCAALDGFNRDHAVLGTSESCIASYPGDFAQALIALDARVEIIGAGGA